MSFASELSLREMTNSFLHFHEVDPHLMAIWGIQDEAVVIRPEVHIYENAAHYHSWVI